mmetsp:Transcript_31203/g.98492  ORF Transcript_31203/g.98492 Transcript_31203/m.98492 type:complete len:634 (+) Transcript_31203:408-2309(+)
MRKACAGWHGGASARAAADGFGEGAEASVNESRSRFDASRSGSFTAGAGAASVARVVSPAAAPAASTTELGGATAKAAGASPDVADPAGLAATGGLARAAGLTAAAGLAVASGFAAPAIVRWSKRCAASAAAAPTGAQTAACSSSASTHCLACCLAKGRCSAPLRASSSEPASRRCCWERPPAGMLSPMPKRSQICMSRRRTPSKVALPPRARGRSSKHESAMTSKEVGLRLVRANLPMLRESFRSRVRSRPCRTQSEARERVSSVPSLARRRSLASCFCVSGSAEQSRSSPRARVPQRKVHRTLVPLWVELARKTPPSKSRATRSAVPSSRSGARATSACSRLHSPSLNRARTPAAPLTAASLEASSSGARTSSSASVAIDCASCLAAAAGEPEERARPTAANRRPMPRSSASAGSSGKAQTERARRSAAQNGPGSAGRKWAPSSRRASSASSSASTAGCSLPPRPASGPATLSERSAEITLPIATLAALPPSATKRARSASALPAARAAERKRSGAAQKARLSVSPRGGTGQSCVTTARPPGRGRTRDGRLCGLSPSATVPPSDTPNASSSARGMRRVGDKGVGSAERLSDRARRAESWAFSTASSTSASSSRELLRPLPPPPEEEEGEEE